MNGREIYISLKNEASASITEKKSEFIAYASPLKTEDEAIKFVNEIKKKHADARHNVYAYILRENNISRYSDDGEPHGTAGLPVLDLLRKEGITDCGIVVTRYFGGILLGTGGLVRAYTSSARAAIDEAKRVRYKLFEIYKTEVSYSDYNKLELTLTRLNIRKDCINFTENVSFEAVVEPDKAQTFINALSELTAGKAIITKVEERYESEE